MPSSIRTSRTLARRGGVLAGAFLASLALVRPVFAEAPPDAAPSPPSDAAPAPSPPAPPAPPAAEPAMGIWGTFSPGAGFEVAKTKYGTLKLGVYLLARWLDQLPGDQSFVDHLGRRQPIDTRNDIQLHRAMFLFSGTIYDSRLGYNGFIWTSSSTTQVAILGSINYTFGRGLKIDAGFGPVPGTRSMTDLFPYWFATDRQMADDFFRPGFTGGIWASGEPIKGLRYRAMLGDSLSSLGVNASQLARTLSPSVSLWFMPTTGEFGPRGGFGDYEIHDRLATRFGASFTYSRENRFTQPSLFAPDNTQVRLTDSLLLFEPGNLAPGVTVNEADYWLSSIDAGMKLKGFALHAEYYLRWLGQISADGPIPVSLIFDHGFYLQAGYQIVRPLAVYAVSSAVLGHFNDSWEAGGGLNVFPFDTRNFRINGHGLYVHRSASSSLFGYYVGGQTGPTISISTDLLF